MEEASAYHSMFDEAHVSHDPTAFPLIGGPPSAQTEVDTRSLQLESFAHFVYSDTSHRTHQIHRTSSLLLGAWDGSCRSKAIIVAYFNLALGWIPPLGLASSSAARKVDLSDTSSLSAYIFAPLPLSCIHIHIHSIVVISLL